MKSIFDGNEALNFHVEFNNLSDSLSYLFNRGESVTVSPPPPVKRTACRTNFVNAKIPPRYVALI